MHEQLMTPKPRKLSVVRYFSFAFHGNGFYVKRGEIPLFSYENLKKNPAGFEVPASIISGVVRKTKWIVRTT